MATPSDKSFAEKLSKATGLRPDVIRAWARAEGAYAPNGTGGYNFLNLRARPGGSSYSGVPLAGVSPAGFARFRNEDEAVAETAHWINTMPNYKGIRASTKVGSRTQIAAIAASPWDAGHYDGGRKLIDAWKAVTGNPFGPQDPGVQLPGIGTVPGTGTIGRGIDRGVGWIGDKIPDLPSGGDIASALTPDPIEDVGRTAVAVGQAIFNPENWLRAGLIIGGGLLVGAGMVLLARAVGAPVPDPMMLNPAVRAVGGVEAATKMKSRPANLTPKTKKVYLPGDEPRRRSSSGSGPSDEVPF